MILYFSACGNSRMIAEKLSVSTNDRQQCIDPADGSPRVEIGEDEPLGLVCPVYAWAVPRIVDDYIKRLTVNRIPTYCYLAVTCGDNVGKTPERFAKTLASKGWRLHAAFSFVMPETYINLKGFNLDTEENARKKVQSSLQRVATVAEQIKERREIVDVVRGKAPWLTSYVVNPLFYSLLITDRKFHVDGECISCGVCSTVCPLHNIRMVDGRPVWSGNCTNCMACYHHCPQNVIHFGKATQGKGRYVVNC